MEDIQDDTTTTENSLSTSAEIEETVRIACDLSSFRCAGGKEWEMVNKNKCRKASDWDLDWWSAEDSLDYTSG